MCSTWIYDTMENYSKEDVLRMHEQCWNAVHIKLLRLKEDVVSDVRKVIQGHSHLARYNDILSNEFAKFKVALTMLDVPKEDKDEVDTKVLTGSTNNQSSCADEVEMKLAISGTHEFGPFTLTINLSIDEIKLSAFLFCCDIPSRFMVY